MINILKKKRFYAFTLMFLLIFSVLSLTLVKDSKNIGESFNSNYNQYRSLNYEIQSASPSSDENVVKMSSLYSISLNNNQAVVTPTTGYASLVGDNTITISSAQDLYAFSVLSNNTSVQSNFLGYDYKLLGNIDYSEYSFGFMPVGWNYASGFTGLFDGNGYEITKLRYISIAPPESGTSPYFDMEYFAMFPKIGTSGIVSNFGLVEPVILNTISASMISIQGVSPVVGSNYGEVSYVFVRDLRSVEDAGIYATGGFQISGFASRNYGSIHDCYTAYTRVVNYEVTDVIDFHELLLLNEGTISNLFFYNSSIVTYLDNGNSTENVEYNQSVGKNYTNRVKFGTYASSLSTGTNSLDSKLLATNSGTSAGTWYSNSSYTGISSIINLVTPITRGIGYNNSTKTFTISNEADFSYVFELMNSNSVFASKTYTYSITSDLNLGLLSVDNYSYSSNIASTFVGASGTYNSAMLTSGSYSTYPTIYNPSLTSYTLSEGVESYGLFSYLSGSVSNLNIVLTNDFTYTVSSNTNVKALGVLAGYMDGATVDNVNIKYNNINLTGTITECYFGSIAGICDNRTEIANSTVAGTLNDSSVGVNQSSGFSSGNAIGGVVGYATTSMVSLYNLLSCVNMNISTTTTGTLDSSIGGILGAGYTINSNSGLLTSNLENRGTIVVTTQTSITNLYVSGIIGSHYGMANQVTGFNNIGAITINKGGTGKTYISGVENVLLDTNSKLKSSGKKQYYASAFTNGANVTINGSNSNLQFANVCNIDNSSINYQAKAAGFYNLAYNTNTKASLGSQTINMGYTSNFAGVINYIGGSSSYALELDTIYNLRNVNFTYTLANTTALTYDYAGVVRGEYISFNDVRNEGNLTFTFNNTMGASSALQTLNVSGVFNNLSNGFFASKIYNGGDITLTDSSTNNKYLNIYVAGICKTNSSVLSDNKYNPFNVNFDDTSIGSLNNVINAGNISVSTQFDKNTNCDSLTSTYNFKANVYAAGIAYSNSGIITNAFNLGSIELAMLTTQVQTLKAGGIACYNTGNYAQIRDSANNGKIEVVDMSFTYTSDLEAGGIVCTNNQAKGNINEVIAFTINYGVVSTFSAKSNMDSTFTSNSTKNAHAKSGGILANGLCNIVNTVNYGNVYSSECAGGLASIVDLSVFNNVNANIANSINYGKVLAVPRYYANASTTQKYQTYTEVHNLTATEAGNLVTGTYTGALISIFNFNSQSNVSVRYLINFYQTAAVVLANVNIPTTTIDVQTFVTTRGSVDQFAGQTIKYAPLSTVEDELGNIGVFSEKFVFRKAINGEIDDAYITDSYITEFFQFVRFDKINDNLLDSIGWRTIAYADAAESFARSLDALCLLIDEANASSLLTSAFTSTTWLDNSDLTLLSSLISDSVDSNELDSNLQSILEYILFDNDCISDFNNTLRTDMINQILDYYQNDTSLDYYELLNSLLYDEVVAKIISSDDTEYAAVKNKINELLLESDNLDLIYSDYIDILANEIASGTSVLDPLFDATYSSYYESEKMDLIETLLAGYDDAALEELYGELTESANSNTFKYILYLKNNPSVAKDIYSKLISANAYTNNNYLSALNNNLKKYDISTVLDSETLATMDDTASTATLTNLVPKLNITPTKDYTSLWNIIKNDSNVQNYIANATDSGGDKIFFQNITDPTSSITYSALLAKATEWNNTYQTNDASQSSYGNRADTSHGGIFIGPDSGASGLPSFTPTEYGLAYGGTNQIATRFVYTPDSVASYATNYYGPFLSDGTVYNAGGNLTTRNYNLGFKLTAVDDTTGTKRNMMPIFISSSESQLSTLITNSSTTTSNTDPYIFYWNDEGALDKIYHWKSELFVKNAPTNTTGFLYNNYSTGEYITDYYDFSPTKVYTTTDDKNQANYIPGTTTNIRLYNQTGSSHTYKDYYFKAYCSTAIITGIWYSYSMWTPSGTSVRLTSLIAKNETAYAFGDKTGYFGIHTSDYTYYKMSDLVALDGIRTKGKCGNIADTDEKSIISAIVTKMLETTTGKNLILKAIANYSKTNTFTTTDSVALNMLLSVLQDTSFSSSFVTGSFSQIEDLTYNSTYTISEYMNSLNITLDSSKDKIIAAATNDLTNFRKLLLLLYEKYDYQSYNYTRTTLTDFIYEYVKKLYEEDSTLSDTAISNKISSLTTSDITNILSYYNQVSVSDTRSSLTLDSVTLSNFTAKTEPDNATYDKKLVANSSSTISYSAYSVYSSFTITIIYKGTINNVTKSSIASQTFNVNYYNSINYSVTSGTEIYSMIVSTNNTNFLDSFTLSNASGLETALNSNPYANLGDMTKDIFSDAIVPISNTFTLTKPGYVIVYAKNSTSSTGTITLNGTTRNLTSSLAYYVYYLGTGTYTITNSNASIDSVYKMAAASTVTVDSNNYVTYTENGVSTVLINTDYTAVSSFNISNYISSAVSSKTLYQTFVTGYNFLRSTTSTINQTNDIENALITLFPSFTETVNSKTYYTLLRDPELDGSTVFTDTELIEIITLLTNASYDSTSSSLGLLVSNLSSSYYDDLLKYFSNSAIMSNIASKINTIVNANPTAYPNTYKYMLGAYLGNDYLNNLNSLTSTKMYTLLDNFENGDYQFITGATTVDAEKFTSLVNLLTASGYSLDISGYGIFALSSSKGINDGIFIPDNFTLSEMDVYYQLNSDSNYELISTDSTKSSEWRGGTSSNADNASDTTSVNYAFLVSMKQLKKSISTAIFTLDLEDDTNTLYSSESLIDISNRTITYYVPTGYFSGSKTFTISKLTIANSATSNKNVNDTLTLSVGSNANAIKITAEDTTMVSFYTIIIEEVSITFDLQSTTTSVPYGGGDINMVLTSTSIPNGFDFTPYLYLVNSDGTVIDSYNNGYTYMSLSLEDNNHIMVSGTSNIDVTIDSSLPTGDYKIYVSIYNYFGTGTSGKYISFTKNPSTLANMSDVSFDGSAVTFTNYQATTYIPYGRCYSNTELVDMSYLDYLPTFSNGSTYQITVTKSTAANTNATITYTVSYKISAENGTTHTYKHYLVEQTPFVENGVGVNYATWYKDGDLQGTVTYQTDSDNYISAEFERGYEPLYRVKYSLDSFYTLGNASYSYTTSTDLGVTASILNAGISAQVTDLAEAGEYDFTYIYTNTGVWNGVSYTRTYEFPSLKVSKVASKDATLSRVTFLDSYATASGLSTVIRPNYSIRPTNDSSLLDANEIYYYDMFDANYARDILVDGKTVKYDNLTIPSTTEKMNYATTDTSSAYFTNDFFVLGSIANAELSYYAPTFDMEDHAEMYQYTTYKKLTEYGTNQTETDNEILCDRTQMYLYVPFVDGSSNIVIFLVELTNGSWSNVYTTNYNGTNETSLGSMNGSKDTTITYNSVTYSVSPTAGLANSNTSLYMDYIGSPASDHFWFVSYIVFSEDYLTDPTIGTSSFNNQFYKAYHVSLIDITNTVYYELSIKAPTDFDVESLFITLAYNTYVEDVKTSNQLSAYANKDTTSIYDGYSSYSLNSNLYVLPNGYFYFYIELPEGYRAQCYVTNSKANRNVDGNVDYKADEEGAYLPPSSIVTQRVELLIEIVSNDAVDGTIWGAATSTMYTKAIDFKGLKSE